MTEPREPVAFEAYAPGMYLHGSKANPTQSFRSRSPLQVVGEFVDWIGHPPETLQAMRDGLAAMQATGQAEIHD